MATGYFISLGDKTSCGGEVQGGHEGILWEDKLHAREGDRVSCGVDGKIYQIQGGVSYYVSHGRAAAGSLDSFSSCPCRASLKPSQFNSTYFSEDSPASHASWQPLQPSMAAPAGAVCDQRFRLLNQRREPLRTLNYALLQNDQCIAEGTLDRQGQSNAHGSSNPVSLKVATGAPSPVME